MSTASSGGKAVGGLRERFRTALALVALTVGAVLFLPNAALAVVALPAVGLAAWELGPLLGLAGAGARLAYLLCYGCLFALLWFAGLAVAPLPVLLPVVVCWGALSVWVFRVRAVDRIHGLDVGLLLLSLPVLAAPWLAVLALHAAPAGGARLVLFLLILVWLTDSVAYFAGRRFGRHKLAPRLSPGKTVEGLIGGLLAAGLWSLALIPLAGGLWSWLALALLCLLTALVSVVGDLVESWLKRRRDLKDAGSLLPGHGGMLDRLDSLVAAAPVFALGFLLWERLL